jgi:hypothetical protein
VGVNQQQRRSRMPCEISIEDSKSPTKVMTAIKTHISLARTEGWLKIDLWKKPSDNWYKLVDDRTMIEIKTLHNPKPQQHYVVTFEGTPKTGKALLRVDVGTLPFKMPSGT